MSNFRETFGNFLETVSLVIGQETVSLGMWSQQIYICGNLYLANIVIVGIETYGAYGPQGINCLPFIYSRVYQWQYKKAMQFVSWVV